MRNLRDDVVGISAQAVQFGLQRLGVLASLVGPAEADDHLGHALIFETPDAIRRVGLSRDHVYLEGSVGGSVLGAQLGQPGQQSGQVTWLAAAVQPAVAGRRSPAQRRLAVAAD